MRRHEQIHVDAVARRRISPRLHGQWLSLVTDGRDAGLGQHINRPARRLLLQGGARERELFDTGEARMRGAVQHGERGKPLALQKAGELVAHLPETAASGHEVGKPCAKLLVACGRRRHGQATEFVSAPMPPTSTVTV